MKITKELVDYVADKTGVKETSLVEKDMILHLLLKNLLADQHFRENYVFKGGTCLIKCYFGYYRFSEDLDFSYTRQKEFEGKSEKQIRKQLSKEIDKLAKKLERIAARLGLEFKADKKDRQYMEFGGGNKFTTFKIWYESAELNVRRFAKIQANYVEKIRYQFKTLTAENYFRDIDTKEFKYLYPEAAEELLDQPKAQAYDIKEILAEKVRAILTRKGVKARDFIDVYLIQKETGVKPEDIQDEILDKTRFILKYEKYRENLLKKTTTTPTFRIGEEERLLIKPLGKDFISKTKELEKLIHELAKQLM